MKSTVVVKGILLILFVWLITVPAPVGAQGDHQQPIYQEDFEDGQAQGWDLGAGWKILQDEGNQVFAGQGHVWADSNIGYDDYRLTFRVKALQGTVHLVYRLNANGRYFIGLEKTGSHLHKQLWPDTFQHGLVTRERPLELASWHQIDISGQGDTLQFSVDGNLQWTYTDPEPLLDGNFSFETLDDSLVYIDDISVELAPTSVYIPAPGTIPNSSLFWVRTGGPLGGLGYDVRMHPHAPDQMFVTDANAGVFFSNDSGKTWAPFNEGITTRTGPTGDIIPIFCLTIDPLHPNVIWAGTQEARGIFKSTDGGLTWEKHDNGIIESQGITFRGFTIDPTNSDIVYAAAEISSYAWNNGKEKLGREFDMTEGAIYKTTDHGLNWNAIWRGNNLARYIWIDPRDTNVLYISTGIFDREAKNSNPATGDPGGEGVLKSIDGGKTWTRVNNGLNNLYVGSLFMHPTNPDILLAGTGNNAYFQSKGAYLTADGGANWVQVLSGEIITAVEFATGNPSIAYAAGPDRVYRSENGGLTWKNVTGEINQGKEPPVGLIKWGAPGIRGGFPIDLQVDPRNPNRIFANAYGGGNFLSEDGGITWTDASRGYTGAQVRAIAVDPGQPGRVLAAARSGLFISNDGGSNWYGLNFPPMDKTEWNTVAIDSSDTMHIVAGSNVNNQLANSKTAGSSWDTTFSLDNQHAGWKTLLFAPSDPAIIYAGTANYFSAGSFDLTKPGKGIFRSNDGGKSWSPANDQLTANANVLALAVDPHNPDLVYAATSNHGLLKTTDGGQNWQAVQGGLPADSASAIAINPHDSNFLIAGFDRKSLFISTDGGITWQPSIRGIMAEARFSSIVFDPVDPLNTIYAADLSNGVYHSINEEKTWALINAGLSNRSVNALAISADGQHLYAASEGGGVFRLDLNGEPPPPASNPLQKEIISTSAAALSNQTGSSAAEPMPGDKVPGNFPCVGTFILPIAAIGLSQFCRRRSR